MNPKQTAPLIATLAPLASIIAPAIPVLLIGGVIFFTLKRLFPDDEKEKKPESAPAPSAPGRPALFIPSVSGGNSAQNRSIPQHSGGIPNTPSAPSAPAIVPLSSAPAAPKSPVPPPSAIPAMKIAPQAPPPPPVKKKFVTREDLANVFQRGTQSLTRTTAVAALKKIGFGKTAAYAALTPDGRFSAWLQFAPDGIITWAE